MKKIFIGVLAISVLMFPSKAAALMNDAQVEISEEYYDDLVEEYGEEFVRYMSQETYNNITINGYELVKSEVHYYKTVNFADMLGNVVDTKEIEISKEEYDSIDPEISTHATCTPPGVVDEIYYDCWETDSKKLYMNVFKDEGYVYYITLTNAWKSSPKVRSYDNIGMRSTGVLEFHNGGAQVIWYDLAGKSVVTNYSYPKLADNGRAYTVSLPAYGQNSLQYPIVVGMHQYVMTEVYPGVPFSIYGAYSHAREAVTIKEATDFTFGNYKGGVFLYGGLTVSAINSKYDNMQGVSWSSVS